MTGDDGEYRGYSITLRALEEVGVALSHEHVGRFWDLMREVAEGRLTLLGSPEEITNKLPQGAVRYAENANKRVAKDRETAQRLLDTFESLIQEAMGK